MRRKIKKSGVRALSPRLRGNENFRKVKAHLDQLKRQKALLPMRGSQIFLGRLAKDCGLNGRQPFYTNHRIIALLADFRRALHRKKSMVDY